MEILVIGKPALNIYLPLQEMPSEGDIFTIRNHVESVGNVGATTACLLGKWKMPVHFTGIAGNDAYAEKIRDTFLKYKKIDIKHTEVDYTHPTSLNYFVLNSKTGVSSKIICNDPNIQLQKYKYDFVPTWAVIDGTDYAGAHALLNNSNSVKTIFYARLGDKDTIALSKRCDYVICTQVFAEMLTHESCDGTAESCVSVYQKIVDLTGKNNYIVILNNHKILYSEDGQVKMLPSMKFNAVDYSSFDSAFVGAFTFATVFNNNINDSIKFANMTASLSLGKVGEETALPELDEVLDNSGLRSRINLSLDNVADSTAPTEQGVPQQPSDNFVSNTPAQNNVDPSSVIESPSIDAFVSKPIEETVQTEIAPQEQTSQVSHPTLNTNINESQITQQQPTSNPVPSFVNPATTIEPVHRPIEPMKQQEQVVETNIFDK